MDGARHILKRLLLLLLLLPSIARGVSYTGDCAIWAQKGHPTSQTEYSAKFFAGTQAGYDAAKVYVGTNGVIQINSGCDNAITLGTLSDSVQVVWHNVGGITRTGAKATETVGRFGPLSFANSGGAIRIVDGVTFASTGAGIQAALDDLPSTGGTVIIPGGTFDIATPLQLAANQTIHGQGRAVTILQPSSGFTGTALVMNADTTGSQQWCAVENLMIDGRTDVSRVVPRGILMKGVGQPSRIRDVTITRCSGVGIWREGTPTNAASMVIENSGVAHSGHHCIYIGGSSGMTSLINVDTEDPGTGSAGVMIDGSTATFYPSSIFIHGLHVELLSSGEIGLLIDDAQGVVADGVSYYGSGNVGDLIKITGSSATAKNITLTNVVSLAGALANTIVDSVYGRTYSGSQQVPYYTTGKLVLGTTAYASLGTHVDGTVIYCSDCVKATPCAGSGTGALALRNAGAWDCGSSGGGGSGTGGDSLDNNTWIYWKNSSGNYKPTVKVDSVNTLRFQAFTGGNIDMYMYNGTLGARFYGANGYFNLTNSARYMIDGFDLISSNNPDFRIHHRSSTGLVAVRDSANSADLLTVDNSGNTKVNGSFTQFQPANAVSATSITLGLGNVFKITGTTTVDTIVAKTVGTVVYIIVPSACRFTDGGGNLQLNGDFLGDNTGNDDTLILRSDGTDWYEVGRSLN